MKRDESPLPIRYSQRAADAYNALDFIALNEGTEESARRAVIHFENQQKVYELIRDGEGIATAKCSRSLLKTTYMKEFVQVYKRRPEKDNICGIRFTHAYALWLTVKILQP